MSGAMERNLDKVLRALENLTEKMDKLDFNLETFDNRLIKLEIYLTIKLINGNRLLKTKVMLMIQITSILN